MLEKLTARQLSILELDKKYADTIQRVLDESSVLSSPLTDMENAYLGGWLAKVTQLYENNKSYPDFYGMFRRCLLLRE